ncbi:hypothetical protein AMECASPLE_006963 [Ameca splendens]|uniref:Uncharacterized protein n=1 Tax=Ameca splendens TaxID=208324 RepID=A0ABV0ZLV4_9TELE
MCPVIAMVPPHCGMLSVNRLKIFLAVTCSLGVKVMLRCIKWLSGTEEECNANSVTWEDKDTCFRLRCHQFVQGYDPSVLPLSTLASVWEEPQHCGILQPAAGWGNIKSPPWMDGWMDQIQTLLDCRNPALRAQCVMKITLEL